MPLATYLPGIGIQSMLLFSHEGLAVLDIQRYFKCTENEINSLFNSALIETENEMKCHILSHIIKFCMISGFRHNVNYICSLFKILRSVCW
jgi:hypothetical protein